MTRTYFLERNDPGLHAFLGAAFLQLRGRRLSRAKRSIGSVLLIDFGKLESYVERGKKLRRGEWRFLIEMSPWKIIRGQRLLLDSNQPPAVIDAKLSKLLVGQEVENALIKPRGDFELRFDSGITFSVKKRHQKKYNNNWVLFCRRDWSVANATEADLYQVDLHLGRKR